MSEIAVLIFAYILDLIIGDPKWVPHPVRIMGWGIGRMERVLRGRTVTFAFRNANGSVIPAKRLCRNYDFVIASHRRWRGDLLFFKVFQRLLRRFTPRNDNCDTASKAGIHRVRYWIPGQALNDRSTQYTSLKIIKEKLKGVSLVVIIVGVTYSGFYILNNLLLTSHFLLLTWLLLVFLASTTLATNELLKSGKSVIDAVNNGNNEDAKEKLRLIVGRDTKHLDNKGILKATIETLSENASDGIIAPLFYFSIGGLPLAMAYKAINTLDSMVGYRNEKYRYFGWAAARLDDIANYIPARITGVLIAVSSLVLNLSPVTCHLSLKTMLRDGRKHLSPNSGIPEAAMAGALGVRLGGPSTYGGILVEKPYIGEEKAAVAGANGHSSLLFNASGQALAIVKITSLLGFGFALILLYMRSVI